MPKAVRRDIIKCLGAAIFLLAAYVLLLQFTSVASPQGGVARYQIGFGTADWSLTERGRHWKEKDPNVTPLKILMNEASFSQELVGELWQTWTIYLAGSCLIVVYFVGFLLWTIGFAVLAKHRGKPPGAA